MRDNIGGKTFPKILQMTDPVIDRNPEQKRMHIDKLRVELFAMGYSVVRTEWLQNTLEWAPKPILLEAAE